MLDQAANLEARDGMISNSNRDQIRMDMSFERSSLEENKWYFDQCMADWKAVESDHEREF